MKLNAFAKTHVGKVRRMNQDVIYSDPERGVFLVADGMGGEKAGDEASAIISKVVQEKLTEYFDGSPTDAFELNDQLLNCLEESHQRIAGVVNHEPDKLGMGSTASLLSLHRGVYSIAQAGDSRIYQARNGVVQQLTRDHTLVWSMYEQGIIRREELETHPERHLLTQCVGGGQEVSADTYQGALKQGDRFLLCSDGLTGYTNEKLVFEKLVDTKKSLEEIGEKLIDAALMGGGGDNVSVVLVEVVDIDAENAWNPTQGLQETVQTPDEFEDTLTHAPDAIASDPPPSAVQPQGGLLGKIKQIFQGSK